MKHPVIKRGLSLLLAALLLFSAAGTAFAEDTEELLIYVPDFTELSLFYNDGRTMREVYNVQSSAFSQTIASMAAGFMIATEDTLSGVQRINTAIDDIFYAISCDENGDSYYPEVRPINTGLVHFSLSSNTPVNKENITAILNAASVKYSENNFYVFFYDWRLSPVQNAFLLDSYIDDLRNETWARPVTLLSAGYGGIVVNALLASLPEKAPQNISRCVFLDSFLEGSSVVGDLMSGRFVTYAANADAYSDPFTIKKPDDVEGNALMKQGITDYVAQDPNGIVAKSLLSIVGNNSWITVFTTSFLSLVSSLLSSEGVFGRLAAGIKRCAQQSSDLIFDAGLRNYLRYMPGLWALVPAENFEEAKTFLFGDEEISAQLNEKLVLYRNIQTRTAETLREASSNGIGIAIVAGYNRQILPITADITEQSDGLAATRYAGAGVTTKDTPANERKHLVCGAKRHKHQSPDELVDASSCYLPEQTWFIKNHRHMDYENESIADFVAWLLQSREAPDVHQNQIYPQFLLCSLVNKAISPNMAPDSLFDLNQYGDINADGTVNAADARTALRIAVGLEFPSALMFIAADVDNDDQITSQDARLILRYAVGLDADFPVERL